MNTLNSVYKYIEIRYADPICSIDLNEKALLFGTMMGRSIYFSLPDKKYYLLSETENEHISGTQLSAASDDKFYVAVGDEKVQMYTKPEGGLPRFEPNQNYENEAEHSKKCENCYTLLSDIYLLRVYLNLPTENTMEATTMNCDYNVKNLTNNESDNGQIEMSSYAVPFDYDGKRFIWVDFYSIKERAICLYNFIAKKITLKETIDESFGHISHIKLLPNGKFFLVRNYNLCEVRNEKFALEKDFGHIGKEVLACDCICNDENTIIATLDIDGNVNAFDYKENRIEKIFNMYDLNGISQEDKDKQFFSMGYPYFIKINTKFFAITTDYGCYLIKR